MGEQQNLNVGQDTALRDPHFDLVELLVLEILTSRISAGHQVLQHGCRVPGDTCTRTLQAAALAQQWVHTPYRELQAAGTRRPRLGLGTSLGGSSLDFQAHRSQSIIREELKAEDQARALNHGAIS